MIENLSKKIEVCAHVGIILMTFLVGYAVVRPNVASEVKMRPAFNNIQARRGLSAGDKAPTLGVDWKKTNRTLLLVISSACKPCKEGAPFFQRVIEELRSVKDLRLVAVLPQIVPQDLAIDKKFLEEMGLTVDEVRQVAPGSVGVNGLPALVLVDNTETVKNVWVGRIPVDKEVEVIDALKCVTC